MQDVGSVKATLALHPCPLVLLVEDDADCREIIAELLVEIGWAVYAAASGEAALAALAEGLRPEVLLVDLVLPGISGVELAARFRAASPARIVAMSASRPPAAVLALADSFLAKPFSLGDLERFFAAVAGDELPAAISTVG